MSKALRVEIFKGKNGLYYWHEKAGNNKIVETGGQGYKTRYGARLAASKFARQSKTSKLPLLLGLLAILLMLLLLGCLWSHETSASKDNHVSKPTTTTQSQQATNPDDPAPVEQGK